MKLVDAHVKIFLNMRKRLVVMAILLKLRNLPSAAKHVQKHGKRSRGRHKQATKALLKN